MRPPSRTFRLKVHLKESRKDILDMSYLYFPFDSWLFFIRLFVVYPLTQFYSHPNLPKLQLHQLAHTQSQIVIIFANLSFAACPFCIGFYLLNGGAFCVVPVSTWKKAKFKYKRQSRSYIHTYNKNICEYITK
jgi:hypothetical protein